MSNHEMTIELLHLIDELLGSVERAAIIMRDGRNAAGLRAICIGYGERPEKVGSADADTLYALVRETCLEKAYSLTELTHKAEKKEEPRSESN